ncbi:uncharacterized protein LOC101848807 [Aplysia californica]|uniref:Protein zwilch n=1 Tax=Aplysia californica TaxID=6500 RepID=A0ABM0JGU8_APLCA|nr:uncharacterized protein LOC101848807 [Aplysia californica]
MSEAVKKGLKSFDDFLLDYDVFKSDTSTRNVTAVCNLDYAAASLAATVRLLLSKDLANKTFLLVFGKKSSENLDDAVADTADTSSSSGTTFQQDSQVQDPTSPNSTNFIGQQSRSRSMFGSPLKLEAIANLSGSDNRAVTSTPVEKAKRVVFLPPVPADKAKKILSAFAKNNLSASGTQLVTVFCFDKDQPKKPLLYGMYRGNNMHGEIELRTFKVTAKMNDSKVNLASVEPMLISCGHDCQMAASYNILEDKDGMGFMTLEAKWSDPNGKLKLSRLPQTGFSLDMSIQSGNEYSPVFGYFCELQKVKRFMSALKKEEMPEMLSAATASVSNTLKELLQNLKLGVSPPVVTGSAEVRSSSHMARQLNLEQRQNKDFTDFLWEVLSQCTDLEGLSSCLSATFAALKAGDLPTFVHKDNQTTIAQLVRQSHSGIAYFPSLTGFLPVRLVTEIGVHKIYKDYMALFLGNRLCTAGQWEEFVKSQVEGTVGIVDMEEIYQKELSQKFHVLTKLHHCLEVVSIVDIFTEKQTLSKITKSLLDLYKSEDLNEEKVFSYPITVVQAVPEIKKVRPSMMKREASERGNTYIDCFLSELPSSLSGFASAETVVSPGDVSSILGDCEDYYLFQTTEKCLTLGHA